MTQILDLTLDSFDEAIGSGDVLVDFWASWCGPCKILSPLLDGLAEKYEGKVQFAKVNVDEEGELAERFGISSIPTVIVFRDGEALGSAVGVQPAEVYESMLEDEETIEA